jgi:predicted Rossmann fold nucleotide-binding protein DprA/Smf involved in DNA uptake
MDSSYIGHADLADAIAEEGALISEMPCASQTAAV